MKQYIVAQDDLSPAALGTKEFSQGVQLDAATVPYFSIPMRIGLLQRNGEFNQPLMASVYWTRQMQRISRTTPVLYTAVALASVVGLTAIGLSALRQ